MYTWGRNVHLGYVPQGRFSSPRIHLAASASQPMRILCVSHCLWVWVGSCGCYALRSRLGLRGRLGLASRPGSHNGVIPGCAGPIGIRMAEAGSGGNGQRSSRREGCPRPLLRPANEQLTEETPNRVTTHAEGAEPNRSGPLQQICYYLMKPIAFTASYSSVSAAMFSSMPPRVPALISRSSTILYSPSTETQGNPNDRPFGTP